MAPTTLHNKWKSSRFAATLARFQELWAEGDSEGNQLLLNDIESSWKELSTGGLGKRAQANKEARDVLTPIIKRGNDAGRGYAQVICQAIQRRGQTVTQMAKATPTPRIKSLEHGDTTVSEADLDATVEMLPVMYFKADGDPRQLTPLTLQQIRSALIRHYNAFSPQAQ